MTNRGAILSDSDLVREKTSIAVAWLHNYDEALNKLSSLISSTVKPFPDTKTIQDFRSGLDKGNRHTKINDQPDWSTSRGAEEVSTLLWLTSLPQFIHDYLQVLNKQWHKGLHIVRDFWAGSGVLIQDLHNHAQLHKKNILFYGVANKIYIDLFRCLTNTAKLHHIPKEILILYTQNILQKYANQHFPDTMCEYDRICQLTEYVDIKPNEQITDATMFGGVTYMFPDGIPRSLSHNAKMYLETHHDECIHTIGNEIKTHFYTLWPGYAERIFLSDFIHFFETPPFEHGFEWLNNISIETAIRSTSHVDSEKLYRLMVQYLITNRQAGSICFNNGVSQSYTEIPRLHELHLIQQNFGKQVKILLLLDKKTNYLTSAVIGQPPFYDTGFLREYLQPNMRIISVSTALKSTYFRLESFVRRFIVYKFTEVTSSNKNNDVFYKFHHEIKILLRKSMLAINNGENIEEIKKDILELLNQMVQHYQEQWRNVDFVSLKELNNYISSEGENINVILKTIHMPNWINLKK